MIVFLFRKVFGSGNSFYLLPVSGSSRLTLKTEGHVIVYVTFCFVRLLKHVDLDHDGTLRFKVTRDGHASGNSQNEFLDLKT